MSSLTKRSSFPELVRRELQGKNNSRQLNSTITPPVLLWDEFLLSTPAPGFNAMRNKASELGVIESVADLLQQEEIDQLSPSVGETPAETKLIKMGIAASYRGEGW